MNFPISTETMQSSTKVVNRTDDSEHGLVSPQQRKTILIVVPGRLFRDGIQRVLERSDRIIAGAYETLDDAVNSGLRPPVAPDLVVVGIGWSQSAAEIFSQVTVLRASMPQTRWIILSRRSDLHYLREAIETGLYGLLLEDSPGEVLQLLTELMLLGHFFVPAELASLLASQRTIQSAQIEADEGTSRARVSRPADPVAAEIIRSPADSEAPGRRPVTLSERENAILQCLVAGQPNKVIARELGIAEATVKVHVKGLLRKMQVANRTQAAISAFSFLSGLSSEARKISGSTTNDGIDSSRSKDVLVDINILALSP